MSDMNDLNEMILAAYPLSMASCDGPFEEMVSDGCRYIAANNGLWREIRSDFIHCLLPIAVRKGLTIPYGELQPFVNVLVPTVPGEMWLEFKQAAIAAMPNECAGGILFNKKLKTWRMCMRESISASPVRVNYKEIKLHQDEILVVDIHSHGHLDAFFSDMDDRDDKGSIRFSAVMGRVGTDNPQLRVRLCVIDQFLKVTFGPNMALEVGL